MAARIPGVFPFMQTLAYRTRSFLANRFRYANLSMRAQLPIKLSLRLRHSASANVLFCNAQRPASADAA